MIALHVEARKAGNEHTWNGEQDDLLVRKLLACIILLRDATGRNLCFFFGIRDPAEVWSTQDHQVDRE